MKKGILILWLVGGAIYTVDTLLIAGPKSPSPQLLAVEHPSTDQAVNRPLRSWDPYLRGHGPNQPSAEPTSPKIAVNDSEQQAPSPDTPAQAATNDATPSTIEGLSSESAQANWVKVILPAKLHRASDISSPIVNYYPPGTVLRAESERDEWVKVVNPATQSGGWILEQYLSPSGSPEQVLPVEQDVPGKITQKMNPQKVAPLPNTSSPLAPSASDAKVAEWEPPTRPTLHERRHRRLGLLGLFRRF